MNKKCYINQNGEGSCVNEKKQSRQVYLSLMDTKKSLGVDEKSSKLAMSNCLT